MPLLFSVSIGLFEGWIRGHKSESELPELRFRMSAQEVWPYLKKMVSSYTSRPVWSSAARDTRHDISVPAEMLGLNFSGPSSSCIVRLELQGLKSSVAYPLSMGFSSLFPSSFSHHFSPTAPRLCDTQVIDQCQHTLIFQPGQSLENTQNSSPSMRRTWTKPSPPYAISLKKDDRVR
jgi:hypothetical protein